MFTKPLMDIEFSDLESFCKRFGEGVRVEYKEAIPKKIPKTISAFANTLGGILILGVKTDENNRAILPIEGMNREKGIEDKITASSLQGVYPAVFPEVKVIDVPNRNNKIVVVVKVHESIEAPHAIENSTKAYIRIGSQSQPYELKLAEIDRIEYMLKRRQKPLERKQRIVSAAENRYILYPETEQQTTLKLPTLQITVSVAFPYQPIISLEQLDQFVRKIPRSDPVEFLTNYVKRVHEGICHPLPWGDRFEYLEINQYGLIFSKGDVRKIKSDWKEGSPKDDVLYVSFPFLAVETGRVLHLADLFYTQCSYLGNVEVRLTIDNILNEKLIFADPDALGFKASDSQTSAFETFLVEEMKTNLTAIVSNLMKSILWIFNYDIASFGAIQERVRKALSANRLINKS